MTNNIFVPQTFNGERMVNVNVVNRKGGPAPNTSTASDSNKKVVIAPQVAPKEPVIIESENSSKSSKSKTIAPAPVVNQSFTTTANTALASSTPTPTVDEGRLSNSPHKYWSEANVAMLIQLHRKYYTNGVVNWTQLAQEYTSITGEDRSVKAIIDKWATLLKKYNAERCCMLPQNSGSSGKSSIPMVSYWNHFQYMDSYLGHIPLVEDSSRSEIDLDNDLDDIVIPSRIENQLQRRKMHSTAQLNESLNIKVLEQALKSQQSQIDLLQKNYETMNQMNLKYVEICEKLTLKTQSNESRYLDLLEKYMNERSTEGSNSTPRKRKAVESESDDLEE